MSRIWNDGRRMPSFREHGLPFTEREIFQEPPVDERGRQGGLPRDPEQKRRGPARGADPPR